MVSTVPFIVFVLLICTSAKADYDADDDDGEFLDKVWKFNRNLPQLQTAQCVSVGCRRVKKIISNQEPSDNTIDPNQPSPTPKYPQPHPSTTQTHTHRYGKREGDEINKIKLPKKAAEVFFNWLYKLNKLRNNVDSDNGPEVIYYK